MENRNWQILYHEGEERHTYFGAMNPPVFQSSNFAAANFEALQQKLRHEYESPFYTRGYNPTVAILRKKLAALENAEDALIFGSGSAAIAVAVLSALKAGDHAIIPQKPYSWTAYLFRDFLSRFGIHYTMVDPTDVAAYENAIQAHTRLIFLESPNSMTFEITDIRAVTDIARKKGILTMIDNSYATPLYQQPLMLGVDLVIHSATKYLSGHSDIVAGVICGNKEKIGQIFRSEFMVLGGILSAHDASELLKGLRTLPLRMEKVSATAAELVLFLEQHPAVEKVYYPFSGSSPQLALAKSQMSGCSGLFSFQLKATSFTDIRIFIDRLRCFLLATSWGGYESLAFPAAAFADTHEQWKMPIPWNLIRISTGLEPASTLIADLTQALEK